MAQTGMGGFGGAGGVWFGKYTVMQLLNSSEKARTSIIAKELRLFIDGKAELVADAQRINIAVVQKTTTQKRGFQVVTAIFAKTYGVIRQYRTAILGRDITEKRVQSRIIRRKMPVW